MNKVKCTGLLTRVEKTEDGREEITVKIKRPNISDTIMHFISDKPLSVEKELGKTVNVEGHIHGFYLKVDNKAKIFQYMVVDSIEHALAEFDEIFHIKGHFYPRHEVKIYVEGTVTSVIESNQKWKSLLLTFDSEKDGSNVAIIGFRKNERIPDYYYISKKDRIAARLSLRASDKVVKGKTKHFENLVVDDLVITNRKVPKEIPETENTASDDNSHPDESTDLIEECSLENKEISGEISDGISETDEIILDDNRIQHGILRFLKKLGIKETYK